MFFNRKIKFIRQLDTADCGTACLAMIARYFGANYTLDFLNELCQKSTQGVDFFGLSNASKQIGLNPQAIKIGVDDFSEETLPCILHWNNNHFVVLYRIQTVGRTTYFYIADPAFKKHRITKKQLQNHFLKYEQDFGYAMLFSKEDSFAIYQQHQRKFDLSRYALKYLRTYRSKFSWIIILMLLASIVTLIIPYITQLMVDKAMNFKNQELLQLLLFAQLGLFIGDSFISFFKTSLSTYVSGKIGLDIIQDFLHKLFKLPMQFFDSKSYGDLSQRIQDHTRLEQFLTSDLVNTLFSITNILIYSVVVWMYGFTIFGIFIGCIVLGILWMYLLQPRRRKIEFLQFQKQVESQNMLHEIVGGIQDLKLFGLEKQHHSTWKATQEASVNLVLKGTKIDMYQTIGYAFFQSGKNIVITYFAALMVMHEQLSFGGLLSLSFVLGQVNNPLNQLLTFAHSYQGAKLSMQRLLSIQMLNEENTASGISFVPGDIVFRGFNFNYVGQYKASIQDLNVILPSGKTTAIVGESGSGKSTLIRLILGYYQSFDGELFIGDYPLHELPPHVLRHQFSTVMQQGYVFDQSFLFNIILGDETQMDAYRFEQALEIANLKQFVEDNLRGNIHTKIGINGLQLSGGQKQRVLIARAVYKKASYFIFDEATSALDTENESLIMNNIYTYFSNKTVILVAHRLSTIKNADQILVMHEGRLVEQGSHEVLLAKNGKYGDLVRNQLVYN